MSLAEFSGPDQLEVAGLAALIGSALYGRGLPALATVLGSGLVRHSDQLLPVVIVAAEAVRMEPGLRGLHDVPAAREIVAATLGSAPEWLFRVLAFVVTTPEPQAAPGDAITSPRIGTVGCQAAWNSGTGFLTAGHVAPTVHAGVFQGRTRLGTVRFTSDPAGGGTAIGADVAVVELSAGTAYSPSLGNATFAPPNTSVRIANGRGAAAVIMGFCSFVYVPKVNGTYGDTYFTTQSVTAGGDSGSAVVDSSNGVVGLVVAGSRGITTFLQDVRYQLAQIQSAGGFPGLTV
jgi:hypothetical protein